MGFNFDDFWEEFGELIIDTYSPQVTNVIDEDERALIVWHGPVPQSLMKRFRPYLERGQLLLDHRSPQDQEYIVRHLQKRVERSFIVDHFECTPSSSTADDLKIIFKHLDGGADGALLFKTADEVAQNYGVNIQVILEAGSRGENGHDLS